MLFSALYWNIAEKRLNETKDTDSALYACLPQYTNLDRTKDLWYTMSVNILKRLLNRNGHYMSLTELGRKTGISRDTLYMAIYSGRLDARKSGGTWLSTLAAVERAIEAGRLRRK